MEQLGYDFKMGTSFYNYAFFFSSTVAAQSEPLYKKSHIFSKPTILYTVFMLNT